MRQTLRIQIISTPELDLSCTVKGRQAYSAEYKVVLHRDPDSEEDKMFIDHEFHRICQRIFEHFF